MNEILVAPNSNGVCYRLLTQVKNSPRLRSFLFMFEPKHLALVRIVHRILMGDSISSAIVLLLESEVHQGGGDFLRNRYFINSKQSHDS